VRQNVAITSEGASEEREKYDKTHVNNENLACPVTNLRVLYEFGKIEKTYSKKSQNGFSGLP
jgi:hypothetical protein